VCRDGACLRSAAQQGGLARALRVPVPADLRAALAALAGGAIDDLTDLTEGV